TAPATAAAAQSPAATKAPVAAARSGEEVYQQACAMCHAAGLAGAPKTGDKAAWAPRLKEGVARLVETAIKGKGAMPPKAGNPSLSDAEIRAAVDFMVSQSK
ncbi:MAG: c-type cytochrome, partial [Burkholderiales bacterium]